MPASPNAVGAPLETTRGEARVALVHEVARDHRPGPIYGMASLHPDKARNVIVIKRGPALPGIGNALPSPDNTRMPSGDAQGAINPLIQAVKSAG